MRTCEGTGKVFISHSSLDAVAANEIVEHLEARGFSCWISSRDISPGSDWAETIYNSISDSSAMLLLFTGNANDSWQIRNELDIATNLKVPIIPVRLEHSEVAKGVMYFTNSHQWLDETDSKRANRLDHITEAVRLVLNSPGDRSQTEDIKTDKKKLTTWFAAGIFILAIAVTLLLTGGGSEPSNVHLVNLVAGGSDSWDYATDITATGDKGFIVTGTWDWGFWSEAWVARFDSTNSLMWSWSDSLSGECKPALIPTDHGGVIVAFGEYADFQHTGYTVRAVRLDTLGMVTWDQRWRIEWLGAIQPVFGSMNRDDSGRIQLAFTIRSLSNTIKAVHILSFDNEGQNMILDTLLQRQEVFAYLPDGAGGSFHIYLDIESKAKGIEHISDTGVLINQIIVGDRLSRASCGALLPDGGLLFLMTADTHGAGNGDLVVMKFTSELELCWERKYGGDMWESASDVLILSNGDILIAGTTSSFGDGSTDGWILLLDDEGFLIWQRVVDCGGNERFNALTVDLQGKIIIAGFTTRYGDPDAWVLEMTSNGEFRDSVSLGIDLLTEDWEDGFIDQSIWLLGRNRNFAPELKVDTLTGNTYLDANSVPLVTRAAFHVRPGLVLTADVCVQDRPQATGSNWLALGFASHDSEDLEQNPIGVREREFKWVYTEGINGQICEIIATLSGDSLIAFKEAEVEWLHRDIPQSFSIETCMNSVVYSINDTLFCQHPVSSTSRTDSMRVFVNGSSGSLSHSIDNIRLFMRRW